MGMTTAVLPLVETIAPADEAEVAEAVCRARRDAKAIYPIGGGMGLDYGRRPDVPGIGLSLKKLDRVLDHPAADMTITVEAGITLANLQQHLAAERQWLPIDVPFADRATVGGLLAVDPSGPRRYAHGTVRDYLLGLRSVDGCGMAFSAGGRVVKNAAGYNLCRMMVGSLGSLGVITQATLMVRPVPETSVAVACDVPDFETAERLLADLVQTQTLPAAIELLTGSDSHHNPAIGPMLQSSVAQLIVGFEGTEAEVDWMVGRIRLQWQELGIVLPVTIAATEAAAMWKWLAELPADLQISVPPSATICMIECLAELDPSGSIQAHAGNGIVRAHLSPRVPVEFTALVRERLRPAVQSAGGKLTVLSIPDGAEPTGDEIWGPPGDGVALMRAIKDRFDPDGLLNPGRSIF